MTKHAFQLHSLESAPEASREKLGQIKQKYGRVPNFFAVAAESPAAVEAYLSLSSTFQDSDLTPIEQQVVILAASAENKCGYCVAAHSRGAKAAGMADEVIKAIAEQRPLSEVRLEALRRFVSQVVEKRGWVADDEVRAFLSRGYTNAQLLDVMVGISMKTLSNYINHVADTPIE